MAMRLFDCGCWISQFNRLRFDHFHIYSHSHLCFSCEDSEGFPILIYRARKNEWSHSVYSSCEFSQIQRIMYSITYGFKQFPQRLLSNILKGSNYTTHASHLKLSSSEIQSAKNYCANLLRYNLGPDNPHPSQLTPLPSSIENTTPPLTRSKPSSRGMLSLPTSPSARSMSNSL